MEGVVSATFFSGVCIRGRGGAVSKEQGAGGNTGATAMSHCLSRAHPAPGRTHANSRHAVAAPHMRVLIIATAESEKKTGKTHFPFVDP